MKTQTRRRFLLSGLSTGAALASLGGISPLLKLARASEGAAAVGEKHRYYIFCYFSGGWDTLTPALGGNRDALAMHERARAVWH